MATLVDTFSTACPPAGGALPPRPGRDLPSSAARPSPAAPPPAGPYPERVAVHEAGHALAAVLLGVPVSSVAVVPDDAEGDADGYAWIEYADAPGADPVDRLVRRALVGAAGMAAECVVFGDHSWGGRYPTTPERAAAARDPEDYFSGGVANGSDTAGLVAVARLLGFSSPFALRAVVETWIVAVARLLADHRGPLFDLVVSLSERRRLEAADVLDAFEAGPPAPVPLGALGLPAYTLALDLDP